MPVSKWSGLASAIRAQAWWIAPQLLVVVALSLALGMWGVWVVYAVVNSGLVWMYANDAGPSSKRRSQLAFKLLAIALVPAGFVAMLVMDGGMTPTETSVTASPDENTRKAAAKFSFRVGDGGSGGSI